MAGILQAHRRLHKHMHIQTADIDISYSDYFYSRLLNIERQLHLYVSDDVGAAIGFHFVAWYIQQLQGTTTNTRRALNVPCSTPVWQRLMFVGRYANYATLCNFAQSRYNRVSCFLSTGRQSIQ